MKHEKTGAHIVPVEAVGFPELPNNIDAEQALLGAILVDNRAYERVAGFLSVHHFYDPVHQQIFEAIESGIRKGRVVTPVTLKSHFQDAEPITKDLTVPQYLGRLAAHATSVYNVADYARTVCDLASRREMIDVARDMLRDAYSAPVDATPLDLIDAAEARLDQLRPRDRNEKDGVSIASAMEEAIEIANQAYMSGRGLAGLSTGFRAIDEKLGGLAQSDLVIIGGRPSMGKTALATTIARNVAWAAAQPQANPEHPEGAPVLFFSLEMSASQLGARLLAADTGISSSTQRRGKFDKDGMRRLMEGGHAYGNVPLYIDATGGLTMPQLATKARRWWRSKNIGLIVVDYLQLMNGSLYRGTNRVQEITEITTGLKALAKELNVPIIALSQLSRGLEGREEKRPMLADLRESGSIEQDADVVLFVYREEYYVERRKPSETDIAKMATWEGDMAKCAGKAEVILAKHRHSDPGSMLLKFDGARTLFKDLEG